MGLMLVDAVKRVSAAGALTQSARHLLLVIAVTDRDDGSGGFWAALDTAGEWTGLSRRSLQRATAELVRAGLIVEVSDDDPNAPSEWLRTRQPRPRCWRIAPTIDRDSKSSARQRTQRLHAAATPTPPPFEPEPVKTSTAAGRAAAFATFGGGGGDRQ